MRFLLFFTILWLLTACTHEQLVRYELVAPEHAQVLQATGYAPIASQVGPTYEEKLMQAMEASRLDAYRRLAEQLYGQQLRAYTRMTGETTNRKTLDAKVQGVVRGAKVVSQNVQGAFYTTELSLDTKVLADLGSVENKPIETENKWWY
ncbi:MAG: outer membrane protein FlgP [Shewanella sp.]|jgi:hypothetical protein|nr:outer membrane protein FlgP [Shewanella sp.]